MRLYKMTVSRLDDDNTEKSYTLYVKAEHAGAAEKTVESILNQSSALISISQMWGDTEHFEGAE
jgi:hypothetical protein